MRKIREQEGRKLVVEYSKLCPVVRTNRTEAMYRASVHVLSKECTSQMILADCDLNTTY